MVNLGPMDADAALVGSESDGEDDINGQSHRIEFRQADYDKDEFLMSGTKKQQPGDHFDDKRCQFAIESFNFGATQSNARPVEELVQQKLAFGNS